MIKRNSKNRLRLILMGLAVTSALLSAGLGGCTHIRIDLGRATPDLKATETAVAQNVLATLAAQTPSPTATSAPSPTFTSPATGTPLVAQPPTATSRPPTATRTVTWTPIPLATGAATPTEAPTATPTGAPTQIPTATHTPTSTKTPTPIPPLTPSPITCRVSLLSPPDGASFGDETRVVVLQWQFDRTLAADEYFFVNVTYLHNGQTWYDGTWLDPARQIPSGTRETRWELEDYLCAEALSDTGCFDWSVAVKRKGAAYPHLGDEVECLSPTWSFCWTGCERKPTRTPTLAPTAAATWTPTSVATGTATPSFTATWTPTSVATGTATLQGIREPGNQKMRESGNEVMTNSLITDSLITDRRDVMDAVMPATSTYTIYLPLIHKHGPPLAKLGVDFGEFWVVVPEVIEYDFPVVREMGAGWMRVFLPWLKVETSPGEYHWEKYDPVFSRLGELGFDVMVVIYGAPDWAAEESCGPISDTLALESFLQVVVPRYAEVVDAWEFTNEPDGIAPNPNYGPAVGCWGLYPAEYARQLGIFYAQIKSLDPDALVFFGGLAYDYWERFARDFLEKALQNGAGLYFDGVSLHHYPINEAEFPTMASKVYEIRDTMSRNGVYGKRLWMTETGQWVNMGRSVEMQRDYIVRELTRGFGAGLDNIFWFDPREHEPWPWGGEVERYLISANHEPMNGYSTFQNFAGKLEEMHCLGAYQGVPAGIEAYKFVGPERTLYILWSNAITTTVSLPSTTDAFLTSRDGDEAVVIPVEMGMVGFEVGVKPVFIEMADSGMGICSPCARSGR